MCYNNRQSQKGEIIMAKKLTKSVKSLKKDTQMSLFESLANVPEHKKKDIVGTIRSMIQIKNNIKDEWRGLVATPPGSFLENVIKCFYDKTDIPLEIPFFTALHYLSAYLLKSGVYIDFDGQKIKPDLWSVILAQSGAGKTFASKAIGRFIDQKADFPDVASSAKFVEELSKHNNGFWLRDEFAQFLKSVENQLSLKKDTQMSLFESLANVPEHKKKDIVGTIRSMIQIKNNIKDEWRGLVATPPGSFLENVIKCFYDKTDIPLEIPFFTALHYLSAYLLKSGVYIDFDGQKIKPDLWSVILAQSGAGKTFASKAIGRFIDQKADFPDVASSAKFVDFVDILSINVL